MATDTTSTLTVDVVDLAGEAVGSVDLPAEWFGADVNVGVMHEVVTAQLAAARQGSHQTKTRGEVRGGGAKPWRQKGTGRARHGSIRSPMWVGGGMAKARTPKDWSKRVNKKVRRAALRSALSDRAAHGVVTVVRELSFDTPRTRDAVAALEALGHADVQALVVLAARHEATEKSMRNLQDVHVLTVDQLNTYDVLRSDVVVIDEAVVAMMTDASQAAPSATIDESPASEPTPGDGEAVVESDDSSAASDADATAHAADVNDKEA